MNSMNPMPLAPGYQYSVTTLPSGYVIVMQQRETKKEVLFFLAGFQNNTRNSRICAHMDSLTEDLCRDQWFKEVLTTEQRKAKQKAEKEAKRLAAAASST